MNYTQCRHEIMNAVVGLRNFLPESSNRENFKTLCARIEATVDSCEEDAGQQVMPNNGLENWSEIDLLTGLILAESREATHKGQLAIGLTVQTRVLQGYKVPQKRWGRNWREVMLKLHQFQCFDPRGSLIDKIIEAKKERGPGWRDAQDIAEAVYLDRHIANYAEFHPTHYFCTDHVPPAWVGIDEFRELETIENFVFYSCLP